VGGERRVKDAAESAPVRLLGRVGLLAYGVVHLLVAYLAFQVATGDPAKADKNGALKTIAAAGGAWTLWLVAVGLGALVIWQLSQAMLGHRGNQGARRILRRAGNVGEAVLFGYLAYSAAKIATSGEATSDADQSSLVGTLLGQPYGKALVVAIGLGVLVAAGFVIHRGLTSGFKHDLDLSAANAAVRRVAVRLGQVGYTALGVVYGIAGALVVVAALRVDPAKATGLDRSLKTLAAQPFGPAVLLVTAAGLAAFGCYAILDARYRTG
jgi:hypothetical protein